MMGEKVLAVILYSNLDIEIKNLPTYESLNKTVEGYIEIISVTINDESYDIIMNEEGKLLNLPITAFLNNGWLMDSLCGNLIISKHDDEGEMVSLTESEISNVINYITDYLSEGTKPVFKI